MTSSSRYFRLLAAFARFSFLRELAFRGNFLVKVFVELLWLGILLIFYRTVFARTSVIATWNEDEYLFFVGCYFALEGLIETLFLENCNEFSDLIRTGDLDIYLLKPIDEQFLLSCRSIDWSTAPNCLLGIGVMTMSLVHMGWIFDPIKIVLFFLLFCSGTAMAYGFLLMLTSGAVWFTRNQSLFELWWLFTSLMRYPREVFTRSWAYPIGMVFTFLIPILLVVNVPASLMVRVLDMRFVIFSAACTAVVLLVSRWFFRFALRKYRSASS